MTTVPGETIRIEVESRWDALELARRLERHHTYLVQLGNRRWLVCVRGEEELEPLLAGVRAEVASWARGRGVSTVVRIGDRAVELSGV